MTILSSGDVGIGTPGPSARLEVAGTVKATAFSGDGSGLTGLSTAAEPPGTVIPILAMIWIKPATFIMGSPSSEPGRFANEGPQTVVTLTKGFWMGPP